MTQTARVLALDDDQLKADWPSLVRLDGKISGLLHGPRVR